MPYPETPPSLPSGSQIRKPSPPLPAPLPLASFPKAYRVELPHPGPTLGPSAEWPPHHLPMTHRAYSAFQTQPRCHLLHEASPEVSAPSSESPSSWKWLPGGPGPAPCWRPAQVCSLTWPISLRGAGNSCPLLCMMLHEVLGRETGTPWHQPVWKKPVMERILCPV